MVLICPYYVSNERIFWSNSFFSYFSNNHKKSFSDLKLGKIFLMDFFSYFSCIKVCKFYHLTCSFIFHFLNLSHFSFFLNSSDICRNKIPYIPTLQDFFFQQSQMLHSIKYDWTEIASCGIHFDFDQCTFRGQKEMAPHTIRTVKSFQNISHLLHVFWIVELSQQVQRDLSYATSYKKLYQRYKAYGWMHMDKMKPWGQ